MDYMERYELHLDELSKEEIYRMIDEGLMSAYYPAEYYNNEWWDEVP